MDYIGSQMAGLTAGMWCPYGSPGELPTDQRPDDGLSLIFNSPILDTSEEILGFPQVTLSISADKPNALLAVRLCDIAPDGTSTLVSRGLLNLTHRNGSANPEALEPGEIYTVNMSLNSIAYSIPAGHRWRLAISPTYWPHAWPSPETVKLSVYTGQNSQLVLPIRPTRPEDSELLPFEQPEIAPPMDIEVIESRSRDWKIHKDVVAGTCQIIDRYDMGLQRFVYNDTLYGGYYQDIYLITEGDPLSAQVDSERSAVWQRGDSRVHVQTHSKMTCTKTHFMVTNLVEAFEGNARVFIKSTDHIFDRDHI